MPEWVMTSYSDLVPIQKISYSVKLENFTAIVIREVENGWKFELGNENGQLSSPNWHEIFKTPGEAQEAALVDACYLVSHLHQKLVDMRVAFSKMELGK